MFRELETTKTMKNSAELKQVAKNGLNGKLGRSIGAMVITGLLSMVPLCAPAAILGYNKYNTKLVRNEDAQIGDVMDGFNSFGKALWLSIITAFFTMLWTLLLYIPGIIKALSYSMAPFILAENPNMTAREALRASKQLMDGKKGKLFYICLSFIGWSLLGTLTCGILNIVWVGPYMYATMAAFYNDAVAGNAPKNEYNKNYQTNTQF